VGMSVQIEGLATTRDGINGRRRVLNRGRIDDRGGLSGEKRKLGNGTAGTSTSENLGDVGESLNGRGGEEFIIRQLGH